MGKKSRFRLASELPPVEIMPTGIPSFDLALGRGGFALGHQHEIWGASGTGKTTLACHVIAEAQKRGLRCCFLDVENNFQDGLGARVVDVSKIHYDNPRAGNDSAEALREAIEEGFNIIVYDSLGCVVTDNMIEEGIDKKKVGGASGIISDMVNVTSDMLKVYPKCMVIYINQIRDLIGGNVKGANAWSQPAPGGHAKEHMMTTRVYLRGSTFLEEEIAGKKAKVGQTISVQVFKNKGAAQWKTTQWNLWSEPSSLGVIGIDINQNIVDVAINKGLFEQTGAWYNHKSFPRKLNGIGQVLEFLHENPAVFNEIQEEVLEMAKQAHMKEKPSVL